MKLIVETNQPPETNIMSTSSNSNMHTAKTSKNDEFYTQLTDIEKTNTTNIINNAFVHRAESLLQLIESRFELVYQDLVIGEEALEELFLN